jgi:CRISPR type III-A-associated protein Csm2
MSYQSGQHQQPEYQKPSEAELKKIMEQGDGDTIVAVAERVGRQLANKDLKTHQIRNFYSAALQIKMRWSDKNPEAAKTAYRDTVLLRPKLAYFAERYKKTSGRGKTEGMEILQDALDPALAMLKENDQPSKRRFDRFMDYFEAIVAYHGRHAKE